MVLQVVKAGHFRTTSSKTRMKIAATTLVEGAPLETYPSMSGVCVCARIKRERVDEGCSVPPLMTHTQSIMGGDYPKPLVLHRLSPTLGTPAI